MTWGRLGDDRLGKGLDRRRGLGNVARLRRAFRVPRIIALLAARATRPLDAHRLRPFGRCIADGSVLRLEARHPSAFARQRRGECVHIQRARGWRERRWGWHYRVRGPCPSPISGCVRGAARHGSRRRRRRDEWIVQRQVAGVSDARLGGKWGRLVRACTRVGLRANRPGRCGRRREHRGRYRNMGRCCGPVLRRRLEPIPRRRGARRGGRGHRVGVQREGPRTAR